MDTRSQAVITDHVEIEALLEPWRSALGRDYRAYRGHVYRVFNFSRVLCGMEPETDSKLAVAAVFHDIGIWSDSTMDYLGPSAAWASRHLADAERTAWQPEIARMIEYHHRIRPYRGVGAGADANDECVEAFRRADLTDLSAGLVAGSIDRDFVARVRRELPGAGFHRRVLQLGLRWLVRHPLHPLPMMRW